MKDKKIPKTIHYCWFGKNELDELAKKCIQSWKEKLPDYEIKLWGEHNFDINSNRFVKEAYKEKKWAFVSDYVRLWAVYNEGGIYLDTDVEVIKSFDSLLEDDIFLGFENKYTISIGTFGAAKNNKWIYELLKKYENKSFYNKEDYKAITPNTKLVTNCATKIGLKLNGKEQVIGEGIHIYPKDFFIAKSYITEELQVTPNTYCIHHYSASWINNKSSKIKSIKKNIIKLIGEDVYFYMSYKKNNL